MPVSLAKNPFELLLNPDMVRQAVEASERLGARLHSRVCRPLDRPLIPAKLDPSVAAFDAAIERASARRS